MIKVIDASVNDVATIADLAEEIWWPTYSPILSKEQIHFMLSEIYSHDALRTSMENGSQKFILLEDESGTQGFVSYGEAKETANTIKIHKLYVKPNNQGKGYGVLLVQEVKNRSLRLGAKYLTLNVNRLNPAKDFYLKIGFEIDNEVDIPIGPFWMNDFVMKQKIAE